MSDTTGWTKVEGPLPAWAKPIGNSLAKLILHDGKWHVILDDAAVPVSEDLHAAKKAAATMMRGQQ